MALPLAMLLSSLMTFGNLGEYFELTALKSAGLSLQQIMKPLIISTLILSVGAFLFSNYLLPYTNLKAGSLLYDIRESKPTLMFKSGVFNNSIEGFSIRVDKKEKDGNTLKGILIYDHREHMGNNIVLYAKEGTMQETPDRMFLNLTLKDGVSYKEFIGTSSDLQTRPLIRDAFKEKVIKFDLSEFKLRRTREELFRNNYQMLNLSQLDSIIDSLSSKRASFANVFMDKIEGAYYPKTSVHMSRVDSIGTQNLNLISFDSLPLNKKLSIVESASSIARNARMFTVANLNNRNNEYTRLLNYSVEWHRKYSLSIACIVLFFIGAPLGAIIRKGGLGMPVVISIIFFLVFHILSIIGEKVAKEGGFPPYIGMWMASAVLMPLGIWLTYKATRDSDLFDITIYTNAVKKVFIKTKP